MYLFLVRLYRHLKQNISGRAYRRHRSNQRAGCNSSSSSSHRLVLNLASSGQPYCGTMPTAMRTARTAMTFSQPRERTPVRADMSGRLFNPLTTKLRTSHVKGTQRCKNHRQISSDTVRRRLKGHKQLLDSTMFEHLDAGHELPPLPMAESESTVDGLPNDVHGFEQI